ncbi:chromatin accessibility complex 16kD protein [Condylostylus longicornis]|uniref:chromatin accessibility complex 16kD protein n=1 Tax=Condylostylus longicornis TaxID=2530218 RepID=UPI00244DADF6|nr:chromatin accessibility complex 16kD protein [Condylostylus longicornis]
MVEPKTSNSTTTVKKNSEPGIAPSRIRTIMKSTDDTEKISTEGLHLMTKATEMFIQYLAKNSIKTNTTLKYEHLSQLVNEQENLEFLLQIIPQKITVKEFNEIVNRNDKDSEESSSESSSEEEENQAKKAVKK